MDLLRQYEDEDDENVGSAAPVSPEAAKKIMSTISTLQTKFSVNPAPEVKKDLEEQNKKFIGNDTRMVYKNPKYEAMFEPMQGPALENPEGLYKNTLTGYVETHHMNDFTFQEQFHTFNTKGYANNPDGSASDFVGVIKKSNSLVDGSLLSQTGKSKTQRKRAKMGDPGTDDYKGPWAPYEDEEKALPVPDPEMVEKYKQAALKKTQKTSNVMEASSQFHCKSETDYQGRSWFQTPPDYPHLPPTETYIPKKCIHSWAGHVKGVSAIRLIPKTAHLLLSCGMDKQVKIWEVFGQYRHMRTYSGHTQAVRDIAFANDGLHFISCSYDRQTCLWDTETGQMIRRFSNKHVPYCLAFCPDNTDVFLVGQADKKILQWDARQEETVQEYDHHLDGVNTVTFVDEARRFVSTSDDKSIRVWDFGFNVPIKIISEPHMHSMPAVTVHPSGKWFCGQSLDNQILTYTCRDNRFRLNRKKRFVSHVNAGYACQINFSPDGQYVLSGDGEGNLWFWDWKTCRVYRKLPKCHKSVTIGCEWHPFESSKVVTCGWDGGIHYWD